MFLSDKHSLGALGLIRWRGNSGHCNNFLVAKPAGNEDIVQSNRRVRKQIHPVILRKQALVFKTVVKYLVTELAGLN